MAGKKKIRKAVESFGKQIKEHEKKLGHALEDGRWDLARYYPKEIEKLKKQREKKKKWL